MIPIPIPKPKSGEKEKDFMDRCMSNDTMNDEYPDEKQRFAVCQTAWKDKKEGEEKSMITRDRDYLHFNYEVRELTEDGKMIVVGTPVVFNRETVIWEHEGVEYKEKIEPSAFDGAVMNDVVLNIDHEGKPAAKTLNNTLKLFVKTDGLYMEADLSQNATGRELYEDIRNGFYDKMSFAFRTEEDSYNRDTHTRTIHKIKELFDVSAVTRPAYSQTSLSARSWAEAQHDIEMAEARKEEAEASRESEETHNDKDELVRAKEIYELKKEIKNSIRGD